MDQFIVIVAVILYFVARSLGGRRGGAAGRRPGEGTHGSPDLPDLGQEAEVGRRDVQQAALEALQRWEERQRRAEGRRPPGSVPGSVPDSAPGSGAVTTPRAEVRAGEARVPRPVTEAAVSGREGRPASDGRARSPAPAVVALGAEPPPPAQRGRLERPGGGLRRLERLAPLKRAIVLAELLGPPLALKETGQHRS